ncbi:three prime repair exonuclease 2-like [Oculina patagonica]
MFVVVRKISPHFVRILPSKLVKRTMIGDSKFSTFIFLDLETTGLQKPVEITELSMIAVERIHLIESSKTKSIPRLLDKFTTCVRPKKEIESYASMVTCLSNEDLENKKEFDNELGNIVRSFITRQKQPTCLVAHNGDHFDFNILLSHLQAVEITLPENVYASDSIKAFRKQHKEAKNESNNEEITEEKANGKRKRFSCALKNLYNNFVGGEIENAHSAEGDVLALLRLVIHKPDILEYLENGAYQLCCQNKDSTKHPSKKPRVSLDEKDANQVQDEYFSQLEKEGLL